MIIGRGRGLVVVGASVAVAVCLNVSGATAQVPEIPTPPDPGTPPTTVAPPDKAPSPAPPAPTDTTLPPGSPDAPPTPVDPAPAPGTTTTTVPADKLSGAALPPSRKIEGSPAAFGLDLSEIDALRRAARGKGPRAPEPDYGFDPELRFGSGADAGTEGSAEEALELGAEDEQMARVRSTSAVAAGLMALLLMGIARGLLRQARPAGPAQVGD